MAKGNRRPLGLGQRYVVRSDYLALRGIPFQKPVMKLLTCAVDGKDSILTGTVLNPRPTK